MRQQKTNNPGKPDKKAAQRSRITLVLLIAAVTAGIPSCRDRETLSPQEQLAETLRKGASLRGYPWPDPYICMLNLGEAIEKAKNLAMTPQQAWERTVSYILSLPEQERLHCCIAAAQVRKNPQVNEKCGHDGGGAWQVVGRRSACGLQGLGRGVAQERRGATPPDLFQL